MSELSRTVESSPMAASFFLDGNQTPPEVDCYYCQIKQKYSVGGESQRCIAHTVPANNINSSPSIHSSPQLEGNQLIEDTLDLLQDVEDNLEDYWQELHTHSRGSVKGVKREIKRVREAMAKVEEKLDKFPKDKKESPAVSPTKRLFKSREKTDPDEKVHKRVKKAGTVHFSQLYDQASPSQVARQWVMHFHKIIATRDIIEHTLPLEQELEMKIFKESMERKFAKWVQNYDRYERRVGQSLERLLYYMESFGGSVNEEVLQADLKFIEQGSEDKSPPGDAQGRHWLMLQAQALQLLLAKCEGEGRGEGDSFY